MITAGNRRFRDLITGAIDEYNAAETRVLKSKVVQSIVQQIKREGGRFLRRDRATGRWVELDPKNSRDKVGHAIRDAANLIESRKQKNKRRKEMVSQIERERRGKTTGLQLESEDESKHDTQIDEDKLYYGEEAKVSSSSHQFDDLFRYRRASMEQSKVSSPMRRRNNINQRGHNYPPSEVAIGWAPVAAAPAAPAQHHEVEAPPVEEHNDPFLQHINEVLGPISQHEETESPQDPLKDFLDMH